MNKNKLLILTSLAVVMANFNTYGMEAPKPNPSEDRFTRRGLDYAEISPWGKGETASDKANFLYEDAKLLGDSAGRAITDLSFSGIVKNGFAVAYSIFMHASGKVQEAKLPVENSETNNPPVETVPLTLAQFMSNASFPEFAQDTYIALILVKEKEKIINILEPNENKRKIIDLLITEIENYETATGSDKLSAKDELLFKWQHLPLLIEICDMIETLEALPDPIDANNLNSLSDKANDISTLSLAIENIDATKSHLASVTSALESYDPGADGNAVTTALSNINTALTSAVTALKDMTVYDWIPDAG